jgi:site-specific DNA-methyltransferase (adenine-specific)
MSDLRWGAWEDELANVVEVDAVITDPPYGARTHDDESLAKQVVNATGQATRSRLGYSAWTPTHVDAFVNSWAPRTKGWFCAFTSHDLIGAWEAAYERHGRYPFAPVPWIARRPRLIGDGPSSWTCYLMVSRPRNREYATWGCLDGAYLPGAREETLVVGGKPLWLMRAIVRDYTRPGELVCDPCAGGGTTLLAAGMEGRRSIGAEVDPDTHARATKRLSRALQTSLL